MFTNKAGIFYIIFTTSVEVTKERYRYVHMSHRQMQIKVTLFLTPIFPLQLWDLDSELDTPLIASLK